VIASVGKRRMIYLISETEIWGISDKQSQKSVSEKGKAERKNGINLMRLLVGDQL
jgi:hypothetical protein